MKKVVIILLLVLPFVLIYFISITGKILEKYSHIYVENILVFEEKEVMKEGQLVKEYHSIDNGTNIEIDKDKSIIFKVEVAPKNASEKTIDIKNFNQEVCQYDYDEKNEIIKITGIKFGTSTLEFSSKEDSKIKFTLNIKVNDAIPTDFTVSKESITLTPGERYTFSDLIEITWNPITAKEEYKGYTWASSDNSIFTIDGNGIIKALKEGTANLIITSSFNPNLQKVIEVKVTFEKNKDVYFDHFSSNNFLVYGSTFDLKTIIIVSDEFKTKYGDNYLVQIVFKEANTNKIIENGLLENLKPGTILEIELIIPGDEDKIRIQVK